MCRQRACRTVQAFRPVCVRPTLTGDSSSAATGTLFSKTGAEFWRWSLEHHVNSDRCDVNHFTQLEATRGRFQGTTRDTAEGGHEGKSPDARPTNLQLK